nr:hypothetical protein [Propionicimonas sp.]
MPPTTDSATRYVELINETLTAFPTPFGPTYDVAFDETFPTAGFKEIRLWVHIFADNYETTPITAGAQLEVRFMHVFTGGSFSYEELNIDEFAGSYINGYCVIPIIGDELRVVCHPTGMPPGPYHVNVTYYLV